MEKIISTSRSHRGFIWTLVVIAIFGVGLTFTNYRARAESSESAGGRVITLHDNGTERGFITKKSTLRQAFAEQEIRLDANDRTEPGLDEPLVAGSYQVNVYRARLVLIRDGVAETKILTSYRTGKQIAKQAGMTLNAADKIELSPSRDPIADGAAEVMAVTRATRFSFVFYGKTETSYTLATTVGDMLKERGITMQAADGISPALETAITPDMTVKLWRDGTQTITVQEEVAYTTKQIRDADRERGYKEVQTKGENGSRLVTYEIDTQDGVEVSRKEISSNVTKQPVEQVEVIGVKVAVGSGLTKAKGVYIFTDSLGVSHRETYYDLPMSAVMRNCGMGGYYTVREDGAKVDRDGYVIVAANLANYPRCSVVETSLGQAKVYDTGGFASVHPHGFDLATDWSNYNGS